MSDTISDSQAEAWNEWRHSQTRSALTNNNPNSARVLDPSNEQLPPGGNHPKKYLIKRADQLGRGLALNKIQFDALLDGCHDEFDDKDFEEMLNCYEGIMANSMIPFWACFTARHMRTIVEGVMHDPDPCSNYCTALAENTESRYFLDWETKYPEDMLLLTEAHAKKTALLSEMQTDKLIRACILLRKLLIHRPVGATAASRLTPSTIEAVSAVLDRSIKLCNEPASASVLLPASEREVYDVSVVEALKQIQVTETDGKEHGAQAGGACCDRNFCENSRPKEENKEELKFMRCSKCKTAWYCSPACQKWEYNVHKCVCFESTVSEIRISGPGNTSTSNSGPTPMDES